MNPKSEIVSISHFLRTVLSGRHGKPINTLLHYQLQGLVASLVNRLMSFTGGRRQLRSRKDLFDSCGNNVVQIRQYW